MTACIPAGSVSSTAGGCKQPGCYQQVRPGMRMSAPGSLGGSNSGGAGLGLVLGRGGFHSGGASGMVATACLLVLALHTWLWAASAACWQA